MGSSCSQVRSLRSPEPGDTLFYLVADGFSIRLIAVWYLLAYYFSLTRYHGPYPVSFGLKMLAVQTLDRLALASVDWHDVIPCGVLPSLLASV